MENKIKNKTAALLLFCITTIFVSGQDPRYSQAFANSLRLNPALMGPNTDFRATAIYRNQWAAVENGYTTMAFNSMLPIFINDGMGKLDVGFSVLNDKAGAFANMDAALSVGYSVQIAKNNMLSFALSGGYVQSGLSNSNLSFDNQYVLGSYNAINPSNEQTMIQRTSYADVGFGLLWFMNPSRQDAKLNAYIGISGFHLNQPNQSFLGGTDGKLPARYSAQGGIKILGNNGIDVSPNVRLSLQNGNVESAVGFLVDYSFNDNMKLVAGSWYRKKDAFVVLLGIEHKSFTIGYSYDLPTYPINSCFTGINSNEISISFKLSRIAKTKMESFGGGNEGPSVKNSLLSSF